MENFVVFFWPSKGNVNFAGKGALLAKRWIWSELALDMKPDFPIDDASKVKENWANMNKPINFSKTPFKPLPPSINKKVCDKNYRDLYFGKDALDIDMPSQERIPNKITAKAKRELFECRKVLRLFQDMSKAKEFLKPVDWKLLNLSNYLDIIKEPMDLQPNSWG